MIILSIDDLKPGLALAEPVRNHQDQLLMDAGRKLTERSIRVLKSWGIRRVAVKSPAGGGRHADAGGAAELPSVPDEDLKARFADVLEDPLMVAIMQAAGRQLSARQSREKAGNGEG